MTDKSTADQLNKLFAKFNHFNLPVRGPRNYLKMGRQNSVAYSYIDCYQVQGDIEHILVTIVQNYDGKSQAYKNILTFTYSSKASSSTLEAIRINFIPNQKSKQISIVHFCYQYKKGKKINKYAVLGFDFSSILNREQLILEDLAVNKKILQARWHPTEQDLIILLTEDSFDILRYSQEIERVQTIKLKEIEDKERFIQIKQFNLLYDIVDFAFWPNSQQSESETIIATLQDGTLFLFMFTSLNYQDQRQAYRSEYRIILQQILKRPTDNLVQRMQVCQPIPGVLLLFKKAKLQSKKGLYAVIQISAIIKQKDSHFQQPLQCIQSDPNDESILKIPYNKLYQGYFYFWHNERLIKINFEPYLNYIRAFLKNPTKSRKVPNQLKTDIVVEVKEIQMKFVAVDNSAIRILRKAYEKQNYLFSTLTIQTSELLAEEQNTIQKLKTIFTDLQSTMAQIIASKSESLAQNLSSTLKTTLTFLKENSDAKEVEGVSQKFLAYCEEVKEKLAGQQKQMNQLFKQVDRLSREFNQNKTKWRQLERLLSKIEANSQYIQSLQIQQLNTHSSQNRSIQFIKKNCQILKSRPLDINPDLRQQYLQSFKQQQTLLWQIHQALEQNENILLSYGISKSNQ